MSDYLKGKRVVDPVLTSIARGYKNAAFVGEHIFPIVQTDKEGSITVPTFGKTAFVEYDTERAVGAESNVLVRDKVGKQIWFLTNMIWLFLWITENRPSRCLTKRRKPPDGLPVASICDVNCMWPAWLMHPKVYAKENVKALAAAERWVGGKGDPIGIY